MGNSCTTTASSEPSVRESTSPFPRVLPLTHHLTEAEAASPMLRSMHSDADAQAHLTTFMQLPSLAQLYNSCKLWRRWLILPQQSGHRRVTRSINYTAESLPHMRCDWLLPLVTEVTSERHSSPLSLPKLVQQRASQGRFVQFLMQLPRFHWLDSLQLRFEDYQLPPSPQLHELLLPFASRLRSLTVKPFNPACLDALRDLCDHLPLFENLESLQLCAHLNWPDRVDLFALPALSHLHTFAFDGYYGPVSVSQASIFAACRSLTSLKFGTWGSRDNAAEPDYRALEILVNSRFPHEVDDHRSAASSAAAVAPVATIKHFAGMSSLLTAAGWDQLSRLTTLETSLYIHVCDLSITKDAWARLGHFTRLQELHIGSPNPAYDQFNAASPSLDMDHLWPPILQMTALTELRLRRCNLHPHHIASLPMLPHLRLTVLAQCHLFSDDLDCVSAVSTNDRRIWLVTTSYGEKRTIVNNLMFPLHKC